MCIQIKNDMEICDMTLEKEKQQIPSRRKRRLQAQKKKNQLIRVVDYGGFHAPMYWNGKYWRRVYSYGCWRRARFYRRYCNKAVRRQKGKIGNGGTYKKYCNFRFLIW